MSCIDGKCRAAELEARAENAEGRARAAESELGARSEQKMRSDIRVIEEGEARRATEAHAAELQRRIDNALASGSLPDWARSILLGVVQ